MLAYLWSNLVILMCSVLGLRQVRVTRSTRQVIFQIASKDERVYSWNLYNYQIFLFPSTKFTVSHHGHFPLFSSLLSFILLSCLVFVQVQLVLLLSFIYIWMSLLLLPLSYVCIIILASFSSFVLYFFIISVAFVNAPVTWLNYNKFIAPFQTPPVTFYLLPNFDFK